jgi:CheY-like chemotaxis protein
MSDECKPSSVHHSSLSIHHSVRLTVLLVGDTERREFRGVAAPLEGRADVIAAPDAAAAAALLESGDLAPDVIVVAQAFPGQYCEESIDRLRSLAPLARVVALLGTWCEGEMRTGRPWPAAVRVYRHQWPARCARELGRLGQGHCPAWGLPPTASEEERALATADEPIEPGTGLLGIFTPWWDMYDCLALAGRQRGYASVWLMPHRRPCLSGVKAVIFDGTECSPGEQIALTRLVAEARGAPVLALLDFPRADDADRALAAGARAVLSKPLLLDDLFWHLDALTRSAAR